MVSISSNIVCGSSCRGHKDNLVFSKNEVHTSNDSFNDLAFANSTFASNIKEHLVPFRCIVSIISPSQGFQKDFFHNKLLFSIERNIFTNKGGKTCRRVIANLRASLSLVFYVFF